MQLALEKREAATEDRTKFIGGSDIAAILGISPWRTAVDVWLEKRGELEESFDAEREKRLKRGHRLEPIVIEMFQEERTVFIAERNLRFVHPRYPFLAAQIDFEYSEGDGLCNGEAKTVDPRHAYDWGPDGSQEVPAHYAAQVMFGLAVTGRARATIAALIGDDLRCYTFERDAELCGELVRRAVEFWNNHVLAGIAPAIQTKEDASRLVRKFAGLSFEATEALAAETAYLRTLKAEMAALKEKCDAAEVEIQRQIVAAAEVHGAQGEAADKFTVLHEGSPILTWNLQKRKGYTVEPCEFRVLRLKGEKNGNGN